MFHLKLLLRLYSASVPSHKYNSELSKDVDSLENNSVLEFQRHYSIGKFSFNGRFGLTNKYYENAT